VGWVVVTCLVGFTWLKIWGGESWNFFLANYKIILTFPQFVCVCVCVCVSWKVFLWKNKKSLCRLHHIIDEACTSTETHKLFLPIYILFVNFTAKMMMIMMIMYSIEHIPKILLLSCLQ
jgi:hypothetical protein